MATTSQIKRIHTLKWKAISMRMVYAYDKTAYARAYREIYSEIQNLINSK